MDLAREAFPTPATLAGALAGGLPRMSSSMAVDRARGGVFHGSTLSCPCVTYGARG